jgi:hypothetical protein
MPMQNRFSSPIAFVLLLILICGVGCSGKNYQKYIPSSGTARQALDEVLAAWKDGQTIGRIESLSQPVQVLDSRWLKGRGLRDYEILGEVHEAGPRCFTARLILDHPQEEQKVRYYVFGIEPLWVCRQEDYDMINHWSCMDEEGPPNRKGLAAR